MGLWDRHCVAFGYGSVCQTESTCQPLSLSNSGRYDFTDSNARSASSSDIGVLGGATHFSIRPSRLSTALPAAQGYARNVDVTDAVERRSAGTPAVMRERRGGVWNVGREG